MKAILILSTIAIALTSYAQEARRVADLNLGAVGSFPSNFTTFNGSVYFSAYTYELGREFFKYDGASLTLVSNINDQTHVDETGGQAGNDSAPGGFTVFDNALYFSAFDQRRGGELWKFDGTRATRVADINPDRDDQVKFVQNSSWPQELTVMGNALYFSADGGVTLPAPIPVPNYELWRYDGTRATLVTNIHPNSGTNYSSYPHQLTVFNNALYFAADDGVNGYELWKCDGTRAVLLANINPTNGSNPKFFTSYKDALYFQASNGPDGYELWRTDGVATALLTNINPAGNSGPRSFTIFKDTLYFAADNGTDGFELWKFDGNAAAMAAEINPTGDSALKNLTVFGDHLYFAADDGAHGWELWKYDGANASLVADLNPDGDAFPEAFTIVGNHLWFTASNSVAGYELWLTDGTTARLAADILPGFGSSFPLHLAAFGSTLCFSANDSYFYDWEFWTATVLPFRITRIERLGPDLRLTWTTLGGTTNIVQSTDDLRAPFTDLTAPLLIPGSGEVSTTYTDTPTSPIRFYRIVQP